MIKDGKTVYVFEACGWDIFDRRDYTPDDGTLVLKTQPAGAPKNGTMNHCYISTLEGEFLGLVHRNSLRRATKADEAKAAETAEQAVARMKEEETKPGFCSYHAAYPKAGTGHPSCKCDQVQAKAEAFVAEHFVVIHVGPEDKPECKGGVVGCYYSGNDRHEHVDREGDPMEAGFRVTANH